MRCRTVAVEYVVLWIHIDGLSEELNCLLEVSRREGGVAFRLRARSARVSTVVASEVDSHLVGRLVSYLPSTRQPSSMPLRAMRAFGVG